MSIESKTILTCRLRSSNHLQILLCRGNSIIECLTIEFFRINHRIILVIHIMRLIVTCDLSSYILLFCFQKLKCAIFDSFLIIKVHIHMIIILAATSLQLECKFLLVTLLWLILQGMFARFNEPLVKGQRFVNTITLMSAIDDCTLICCYHHRRLLLYLRMLNFMAKYLRSFPYFKWTNFLSLDTLSQFINTIFKRSEMDVLLLRGFVFLVFNQCLTISDSN